ncbi:MAG TPA: alpha/beta hydrolase [Acidimicrobiia bacterium]|nr:alpha/beta hydrolase [Acidimicrobiia bacterium]
MPGQFRQLPHGTVYVHDFGGEGRPVVAIHGLGGAHLNWLPVADGLRHYGQVLAPDLPGFGYSPPQESYNLSIHTRAVIELLESLGGEAVLLGNSLGGLITMMVAARRPDLIERLILVAPATPPRLPDPSVDLIVTRRLVLQGLPIFGPEMVRRYWRSVSPARQMADTLAIVCHRPERVPREVIEESLVLATARRQQSWAVPALVGTGRSTGVHLANRPALARMVRSIESPTVIIRGGHDRVVASSGISWLAALRPDWKLAVMEDSGHCPQLEQPVEFLAIVDEWIKTSSPVARIT